MPREARASMIVYFLTCGVVVVVVFAFASPCTGRNTLHTRHHQPPHVCAIVSCCGAYLRTRAQLPFVRTNTNTAKTKKNYAPPGPSTPPPPPPPPSTSPVVLRINHHRFSTPFERLAGGHLVQGTSSLLLIACDHAFRSSPIVVLPPPFVFVVLRDEYA